MDYWKKRALLKSDLKYACLAELTTTSLSFSDEENICWHFWVLLADWHILGLTGPSEITHLESNNAEELSLKMAFKKMYRECLCLIHSKDLTMKWCVCWVTEIMCVTQSKAKTEKPDNTVPCRTFIGHETSILSDTHAAVLRSDHLRSCFKSRACNYEQFNLSLCQVLV